MDISLFRQDCGGDPEIIKKWQKDRFKDEGLVDTVVATDKLWRDSRYKIDRLKRSLNICSKSFSAAKKNNSSTESADMENLNLDLLNLSLDDTSKFSMENIKDLSKQLKSEIENLEQQITELEKTRKAALFEIANELDPRVLISNDEDQNPLIRQSGDITSTKSFSHIDLLEMIGGVDYERGVSVGGSRCYFLKGPAVCLEMALLQYAMFYLNERDYQLMKPPYMMKREVMAEVAQLSQFDEELYKVVSFRGSVENGSGGEEADVSYLIATSEQPIAAFHRKEWIPVENLPLKYAGVSTCFRQECGSHGRDTRGIFRVHQFEKIEQFCYTSPVGDESSKMFDFMISNSEEFYRTLGIAFRVVSIVSGALNNAAAIKFDLEGWFPGSKAFRELVSCSNCTDYQSRRLNIRYGVSKNNDKAEYVHMLNSTLCASTRTICVILETWQTEEGIRVPPVLANFMPPGLREVIPFIKKSAI